MAHESFEDDATAAYLNEHFVAIKVDREERPDVDAVYMEATQALTGQGGWPMTVFATPDGEPFFCGTYFPPAPRHGMPSFRAAARVGRRRPGPSGATRCWRRASASSGRSPSAALGRRRRGAARRRSSSTRPSRSLVGDVRRGARRLRRRPEVPAVDGARAPAAPPRAHR